MAKKLLPKLYGAYLNTLSLLAPRYAARIGFERFCRPMRVPIKPHQLTWLESSKDFTLAYGGRPVQVYSWGSGPRKVLFLHGWQSHAYFWKRYVEQLPDDITAYAIDAPGHGLSGGNYFNLVVYSQVVEQFLNRVGQIDAIVGHSLGGFTAIYSLARLPQFQPRQLAVLAMPGEVRVFWDQYYDFLGFNARTRKVIDGYCVLRLGGPPESFSAIRFAKALACRVYWYTMMPT